MPSSKLHIPELVQMKSFEGKFRFWTRCLSEDIYIKWFSIDLSEFVHSGNVVMEDCLQPIKILLLFVFSEAIQAAMAANKVDDDEDACGNAMI